MLITRTVPIVAISLLSLTFGSSAIAGSIPELACFKVSTKAQQRIEKAENAAVFKDCALIYRDNAERAKKCESGDIGCHMSIHEKYTALREKNATKLFNRVNITIEKATAKLGKITADEGDDCADLHKALPEPYADVEAAGTFINGNIDQCINE